MSRYPVRDQHGLTFITCTVVGWIDVFTRKAFRDIILDSLRFCQREKGLKIFAYVIMSNHIHLIVQAEAKIPLSNIIRDFKKYTATHILEQIQNGKESRKEWMAHIFAYFARYNTNNRRLQFWIQDNHPTSLFSPWVTWQKVNYIHNNPVRAGWVENPEDYLYSSARNYASNNNRGLLMVDLLEPYLPGSGFVFSPGV